jgi:thiol-disulfide isomerase/thioredoxin
MQDPKADYDKLQKAYLADLQSFVSKYPKSSDSAEAIIQMALSSEFSGDAKIAAQWYRKAQTDFPTTLAGQKAAGALKRLDLIGNRFGLKSPTLDGRTFSSEVALGGPVIYHCWASWCEGCKAEMRALKQLQNKYANDKLQIVGINFDNDSKQAVSFLRENSFPWVHLYDQGGLDSQLAISYGILTLPVNFVVDKTGKVVKTGVHWSELDGVIEELIK